VISLIAGIIAALSCGFLLAGKLVGSEMNQSAGVGDEYGSVAAVGEGPFFRAAAS